MTIRLRKQAEHLKKDKIYLSDSLADISYQVRTPLTSIRLLVSRLHEDGLELSDKNGLTFKINRLLTRTEWLVTVLLKISKLESGTAEFKTAPVNVAVLVPAFYRRICRIFLSGFIEEEVLAVKMWESGGY